MSLGLRPRSLLSGYARGGSAQARAQVSLGLRPRSLLSEGRVETVVDRNPGVSLGLRPRSLLSAHFGVRFCTGSCSCHWGFGPGLC